MGHGRVAGRQRAIFRRAGRKRWTAFSLVGLVIGMFGLAYAAVPLYRWFCEVTGFGGTTQVATGSPGVRDERRITVRFDANVGPGMPWVFAPPARSVEIALGGTALVAYTAVNPSAEPVLGSATFNVTPANAGKYFSKIECFCFTEQLLMPGERKELPVSFFVGPKLAEDPNVRDVGTITLSYTFFNLGRESLESYLRAHAPSARVSTEVQD